MKIHRILQILNEYDNSGNIMTLAAQGGKKATGKNYDNIAAGKTSPYKTQAYQTQKEKQYPNLGKITQQLKTAQSSIGGDKVIMGAALNELQQLLPTMKKDVDGTYILPFGDNLRVKQIGNAYYLHYNNPDDDKQETMSDTQLTQLPL